MADVSFPAHVTITEEVDLYGLPVITADVTLTTTAAALELPEGPEGDPGPPGEPQAPFIKMGEIANEAARPDDLGPDDRGKWWHRLDDDSMDFWDGTDWVPVPDAVGPQGPVAPANTLTALDVISDEATTIPAVDIRPVNSSEQTIQLTVPAGVRGATGPAGSSGTITTSPDYDSTQGPVKRSMFAFKRTTRRFAPTPPPCGYGPYFWDSTAFAADASGAVSAYKVLTATMPVLPFAWRPQVFGAIQLYNDNSGQCHAFVFPRLYSETGVALGIGANPWQTFWDMVEITEHYGNPNSVGMSPSSDYAVVPANSPSQIVVMVERQGSTTGTIGYRQAGASLTVYAMPVSL
ncbi:hypothetical protein [Nocardia sp. NPDC019255]|uniref:hypothetical protein n=1 Tax=Nocardia sp. NPDC019255 TaxID=3154591 RepID=UPI00340B03F5